MPDVKPMTEAEYRNAWNCDHHTNCSSREGKTCDCYAKQRLRIALALKQREEAMELLKVVLAESDGPDHEMSEETDITIRRLLKEAT